MKLTKEGKTYTLVFEDEESPEGRKAENWCGVAALRWLSVVAGQPIGQEKIAEAIYFDPNEGTDGDQILMGVQAIGLYSSPWMQLTLEQCQKALDTQLCQILVNWTHGDHPDYNHYSSLAAADGRVVLQDTQVDGGIFILRPADFQKRWHYGESFTLAAENERNWALVITKSLADWQRLLQGTPT